MGDGGGGLVRLRGRAGGGDADAVPARGGAGRSRGGAPGRRGARHLGRLPHLRRAATGGWAERGAPAGRAAVGLACPRQGRPARGPVERGVVGAGVRHPLPVGCLRRAARREPAGGATLALARGLLGGRGRGAAGARRARLAHLGRALALRLELLPLQHRQWLLGVPVRPTAGVVVRAHLRRHGAPAAPLALRARAGPEGRARRGLRLLPRGGERAGAQGGALPRASAAPLHRHRRRPRGEGPLPHGGATRGARAAGGPVRADLGGGGLRAVPGRAAPGRHRRHRLRGQGHDAHRARHRRSARVEHRRPLLPAPRGAGIRGRRALRGGDTGEARGHGLLPRPRGRQGGGGGAPARRWLLLPAALGLGGALDALPLPGRAAGRYAF